MTAENSPSFSLCRTNGLARRLQVNPSTIWRWRKQGILPPPVQIGSIRGWTEAQLKELDDKLRAEAAHENGLKSQRRLDNKQRTLRFDRDRGVLVRDKPPYPFDPNRPDLSEIELGQLDAADFSEWIRKYDPEFYREYTLPQIKKTLEKEKRQAGRAALQRIAKRRRRTTSSNGRAR